MNQAKYLSEEENLADLEAGIASADKPEYESFRHMKIEAAFIGRVFVLYRLQKTGDDGATPDVVCKVRVRGFQAEARKGCTAAVERLDTGEVQMIGHTPARLFGLPIFVSVPPFQRIRYDGVQKAGGLIRSMSFALLFKQRSRSDYSIGCLLADTPNKFRKQYPQVDLNLPSA